MDGARQYKRIFDWCSIKGNSGCKNGVTMFERNLTIYIYIWTGVLATKSVSVRIAMLMIYPQEEHVWLTAVENQQGVSERGQNMLRTYRLMKGEYKTENLCSLRLLFKYRSAFALF